MKRLIAIAGLLTVAGAYFVLSALPALSADSGNIDARVNVAAPCIAVTMNVGVTVVDFGTKPFSTPSQASGQFTSGYSFLQSCAAIAEKVFARGTNAAGLGGAAWQLAKPLSTSQNPCAVGTDKYFVNAVTAVDPTSNASVDLTTVDEPYFDPEPGKKYNLANGLQMPCTGSSGAGQTMSFQFIYTAAF